MGGSSWSRPEHGKLRADHDALLTAGLDAHVVVAFGQPLGVDGPLGPEAFGFVSVQHTLARER
jgi:hypothetical protein